jgi:hypothetical protein
MVNHGDSDVLTVILNIGRDDDDDDDDDDEYIYTKLHYTCIASCTLRWLVLMNCQYPYYYLGKKERVKKFPAKGRHIGSFFFTFFFLF